MDKHFICLANSYKRGGRCVAGVEVTIDREEQWKVVKNEDGSPKWIRPIDSNTEYGEVPEDEARHIPMLSVVKLIDVEPCPHLSHSEDVFYYQMIAIGSIISSPEILQIFSDSVHPEIFYTTELAISPETYAQGNYSLMMIHPDSFQFQEDPTKERAKYRIKFDYNEALYDFSVTDPSFYEMISSGQNVIDKLKDIYLTLSIGLVYEGRHHKLVAGVIIPSSRNIEGDKYVVIKQEAICFKTSRMLSYKERRSCKCAFVVPTQKGLAVCVKKKSGQELFFELDEGCIAEPWQSVNLKRVRIMVYQDYFGNEIRKLCLFKCTFRQGIIQKLKRFLLFNRD